MQQLKLFDVEASSPQPPLIKLQTWEKLYREYRGAFTTTGQRLKKKKLEYDYQCDIHDDSGKWITYIEITSASPKSIESEFYSTVDSLIAARHDVNNNAIPELSIVPSYFRKSWDKEWLGWCGEFRIVGAIDAGRHIDYAYECDVYNPEWECKTRLQLISFTEFAIDYKFRHYVEDQVPINKETNDTQQPENPNCDVLEQVNNDAVPELSRRNILQWVEVYTPSKRKKNSYYRYCYKHNGKIHHSHIAGGSVKAPLAISRYEEIEQAIVRGLLPHQIKAIIAGWKVEK